MSRLFQGSLCRTAGTLASSLPLMKKMPHYPEAEATACMWRQAEENDPSSAAMCMVLRLRGRNTHLGGAAQVDTKKHAPESGSGMPPEIAPHLSSHYLTNRKKFLELHPWSFLTASVCGQK